MCMAITAQGIDKAALVKEVKQALYASKICSYAQGLNIIKAKSAEKNWGIDMGALSRIWKVCTAPHPMSFWVTARHECQDALTGAVAGSCSAS